MSKKKGFIKKIFRVLFYAIKRVFKYFLPKLSKIIHNNYFPIFIGLLLTSFFIYLTYLEPYFFKNIDKKILDNIFCRKHVTKLDKRTTNVVIIGIDESSFSQMDMKWPWENRVHADVIKILTDAGAKAIGFDTLTFSEPSYKAFRSQDKLLGDVASKYNNVIFVNKFEKSEDTINWTEPIDTIMQENSLGYVNQILDSDGILRRTAPFIKIEAAIDNIEFDFDSLPDLEDDSSLSLTNETDSDLESLEELTNENIDLEEIKENTAETAISNESKKIYKFSLAMELIKKYMKLKSDEIEIKEGEYLKLRDIKIPLNKDNSITINYSGPANTIPYISYFEVFKKNFLNDKRKNMFKDKIVLIGPAYVGAHDYFSTPFLGYNGLTTYGVEVHAQIIHSVFEGKFIKNETVANNMLIVLAIGLISTLATFYLKLLYGFFIIFLMFIMNYLYIYMTFMNNFKWVNFTIPAITGFFIYFFLLIFKYLTQEREKKRIRNLFSSYVNESIIDELMNKHATDLLRGQKRTVTIFFSDIRSFTTYSEKYPPEQIIVILNEYLSAMTDIIIEHNGTVDKFVGDEIMAVWGAPIFMENHAELAVRSAVAMLRKLKEMQEDWIDQGIEPFDIGIGLNTGDVISGNIGSEKKMDYTVIGDSVNLAARLEALTRDYNNYMVVSEYTYEHVKDKVEAIEIGEVIVKGKRNAVKIYELNRFKDENELIPKFSESIVFEYLNTVRKQDLEHKKSADNNKSNNKKDAHSRVASEDEIFRI